MPSDPPKKPLSKAVSEPKQLEDQIRERAYELYEARGRETATTSKTGSVPKEKSWRRRCAASPPDKSERTCAVICTNLIKRCPASHATGPIPPLPSIRVRPAESEQLLSAFRPACACTLILGLSRACKVADG